LHFTMASSDGRVLLGAMADGRLASTIAEEATGGSATMDDVIDRALATCLSFKYCRQQPQAEKLADADDGNSSDEEEMDMLACRRQAKEVSKAAVANGCLPSDAVRQSRQKSPFASMAVWQDAIEVLQGIVASPSQLELHTDKPSLECLNVDAPASSPQVLDAGAVTPTACRPTRPTSARTSKSRPVSHAASRPADPTQPKLASVVSPKFCVLRGLPPRSASAARLPPVKTPSRVMPAEPELPRPAASALEMDLGFGGNLPEGRPFSLKVPLRGAMVSSKSATNMSLPPLPGVLVATDTRFSSKSLAKLSMRPMTSPEWGISPSFSSIKWDDQSLIC